MKPGIATKFAYSIALLMLIFVRGGAAQLLDFDGDGLSDPAGFENQHDGSPNELGITYLQSDDNQPVHIEYGSADESVAHADYDGDGVTDLAVVGVAEDLALHWRFRLSSAEGETTADFGQQGDSLLSGCDFDGDDHVDMALIRQGAALLYRSSSDDSEHLTELLETYDFFSCGDLDNDGVDELIAGGNTVVSSAKARARAISRATIKAFTVADGATLFDFSYRKRIAAVQALDVDGDGTKEVSFLVAGNGNFAALFYVKNGAVNKISLPRFQGLAAGRFAAEGAEGVLLKVKANDTFTLISSLTSALVRSTLVLPRTATVLSAVNYDLVGPTISTEPGCTSQHNPFDGADGFLWKPVSDTKSTAVVLFPATMRVAQVKFVKGGTVLETPYSGGNGNGGRDHFRSRKKANFFPSNFTVMATLRGGAGVACWVIENPLIRID